MLAHTQPTYISISNVYYIMDSHHTALSMASTPGPEPPAFSRLCWSIHWCRLPPIQERKPTTGSDWAYAPSKNNSLGWRQSDHVHLTQLYRVQLPPVTRDDMMIDISSPRAPTLIVSSPRVEPRAPTLIVDVIIHVLLPSQIHSSQFIAYLTVRSALVSRYKMTLPFKVSAA